MSAIWGVISEDTKLNYDKIEEKMRLGYEHCVIDSVDYYVGQNAAFGCGIQYFTPQAKKEHLPIVEQGICFTADAVVDNREELLERLGLTEHNDEIPDARIIFEMFKKYKEECLNDIIGAYSFVYYDERKRELYLVADSTGTRSLNYYIDKGTVFFSTLIEPILAATGAKHLNEQWITDFLALDNMAWAIEYDKTPYSGIYKVPAAHYVRIRNGKSEVIRYWKPEVKELRGKTDQEYKELFRSTFEKCVKQMMRNEKMTILLSGGLDSSSVACFAAKHASQSGQTLTSFTSVPEKGFQSNLSDYYVTDESEAVRKTQAFLKKKGYPLECRFMELPGRNSWDDRIEEIKALEMPYKSMQNLIWLKEGMIQSYKTGARMMLTGSYGNVTISNSFTSVYQRELIRHFHWIRYIDDCIGYSRKNHLGKKETVKIAAQIVGDALKPVRLPDLQEVTRKSFLKKEFVEKYDFWARYKIDHKKYEQAAMYGNKAKELMINDKVFYQIGETETKHSLVTGVIMRDPTMDKRLIELCLSLPLECYSREGVTRRLVREYLAEDLPEHVVKPVHYGLQSADTALRLQKEGDRIFREISEIFNCKEAEEYIDKDKALAELVEMKEFNAPDKNFKILRLEYTALVIEYIKKGISDGKII